MKMGVISDAIDSLETWCSNLFKDGVGDTIKTGEYFANVTSYQHCDNLENTGENYIHLKVKIDTDTVSDGVSLTHD